MVDAALSILVSLVRTLRFSRQTSPVAKTFLVSSHLLDFPPLTFRPIVNWVSLIEEYILDVNILWVALTGFFLRMEPYLLLNRVCYLMFTKVIGSEVAQGKYGNATMIASDRFEWEIDIDREIKSSVLRNLFRASIFQLSRIRAGIWLVSPPGDIPTVLSLNWHGQSSFFWLHLKKRGRFQEKEAYF